MNRVLLLVACCAWLFFGKTHAQITFDGGSGKGSDGSLAANAPAPPTNSSVFEGGDADGFATASDGDFAEPLYNNAAIFRGKPGDGFSSATDGNDAPPVLNSDIFAGGSADGFAIQNLGNPTPVPLPLRLVRFQGRAREDHNRLTWEVAELENPETRFVLERSTGSSTQYEPLDTLRPSGEQIDKQSGEFLYRDFDLQAGLRQYTYRLKQLSKGQAHYFGPVSLSRHGEKSVRMQLYPNPLPSGQNGYLQLEGLSPGRYQVTIRSATGQVVYRKPLTIKSGSSQHLLRRPGQAASGLYWLELSNAQGFRQRLQLILE